MGKVAGELRIKVSAGTAEFITDMARAEGSIKKFGATAKQTGDELKDVGTHGVSGVQAVSGALRVLEGGITNNLRAAERFTANVLGLGPILQAAFPIIGAIAFAGILVKLGEEAGNFYKSMRDAPEKLTGAWRTMSSAIGLTNDQTQVSIDKLNLEIAKLEGHRQNTLKLALDEAVVSADQLAISLDKDIANLSKLISENDANVFKKLITGEPFGADWGSDPLAKKIGGYTGEGGFNTDKSEIIERGTQALLKATTAEQKQAAQLKMNTELVRLYDKQIGDVHTELIKRFEARMGGALPVEKSEYKITGKEGPEVERALVAESVLKKQRSAVLLTQQLSDAEAEAEAARAKHANDSLDRSYDNKLAELTAQAEESKARLAGAGLGEFERLIEDAKAKTIKAVQEVNQQMNKQHAGSGNIKPDDPALFNQTLIATRNESERVWRDRLRETTAKIEDQIDAQKRLTAAIGQGYEAQQKARVEIAVMGEVGHDKYFDKSSSAQKDVDTVRAKQLAADEATQNTQRGETLDKLNDQIGLERTLAQVQQQSVAAIRLANLEYSIKLMLEKDGAAATAIASKMREEFYAQEATATAKSIAALDDQIADVERLEQAQLGGAESARRAQEANKLAEIRKRTILPNETGPTKEEFKTQILDQKKLQADIGESVSKRVGLYTDELFKLRQERDYLDANYQGLKRTLEVERARREINEAIYRAQAKQTLEGGKASDGIKAFFIELQASAEKTSNIIYNTLNSGVDKFSDSLSKAMTGQKAAWGQMFKSLGDDLLKSTIKSTLQTQLVKLGQSGALGKGIQGVLASVLKPDGSANRPFWVRMVSAIGGIGPGGVTLPNIGGIKITDLSQIPINPGTFGRNAPKYGSDGRGEWGPIGSGGAPSIPLGQKGGLAPDGTEANPFYVVMSANPNLPKVNAAAAGLQKSGSILSTIGSIIGSVIPRGAPHAGGGPVSAGVAYPVGEMGIETFVPASSGTVYSNATSKRMFGGGDTHVYSIDARGTDPVQTEQRVRTAIITAHNDAVSSSVLVHQEQLRRSPRSA